MTWSDIKKSDTPKSDFIKLQAGKNVIRILSEPEQRFVHFIDSEKKSYTCKYKTNDEFCDYCEAGLKPSTKYLFYIIDRADQLTENGDVKIKLGEFGWSVVKVLEGLKVSDEYSFDVAPDYDIIITKTGTMKETRYETLAARQSTPLTEAEVGAYSLMNPLTEAIENMSKKKDGEPTKIEFTQPPPQHQPVEKVPMSDEDYSQIPFN